jgi:ABC-type Mn2+/Zn2+ transport system ATPase subunit
MLEKVHIKAFRSCVDLSLEFTTPIVALVGRNGAGKTNILKGIEWLARTATSLDSSSEDDFFVFHVPERNEVSVDVELSGKRYRYSLAREAHFPPERAHGAPELTFTLREELIALDAADAPTEGRVLRRTDEKLDVEGRAEPYRIGPTSPSLSALAALLPQEDPLRSLVLELRDFLASIRYYPLDEPMVGQGRDYSPVIRAEEYSKWRAQPEVGSTASVTMRLLHLFLEKTPDRFGELRSLLGPDGLGLLRSLDFKRYDVPAARKPENRSLYVLEVAPSGSGPSDSFAYGELSAGTRRIIRLLVSLLSDDSSVMLLEQPEDSIHAGLTSKLLGLLKTYKERTVVLTTHSATMFNALEPENIRLVTMRKGATRLRALSPEELSTARAFLEDEGSLSDFIESVEED